MAGDKLISLFICVVLGCFVTVTSAENSTLCVTCSYVYNVHNVSMTCVNDPLQGRHGKTLCPHGCLIVAVYTAGYQRLNSLSRMCWQPGPLNEPEPAADKVLCDNLRCMEFCDAELCNDGHGNLYDRRKKGTGDDDGSGMAPLGFKMVPWGLVAVVLVLHFLLT